MIVIFAERHKQSLHAGYYYLKCR